MHLTPSNPRHLRSVLVELPLWYDVDDAASLEILTAELLYDTPPAFAVSPGYPAPQTRALLRKLETQFETNLEKRSQP